MSHGRPPAPKAGAEGGRYRYFVEGAGDTHFVVYIPHGSHVVLGGVAGVDDWNRDPDPVIAARILDRCAEIEPRLRGARVIGHSVGLRPDRVTGVRLDEEQIAGARCIHNYGHGSVGVSLSWGSAREAAALVGAGQPWATPGQPWPTPGQPWATPGQPGATPSGSP